LILTGLSVSFLSWLVGLVVFGWWLFPVQWQPDKFNTAPIASQIVYVHLFSEWYAYSGNTEKASQFIQELDRFDEIACYLADSEQHDMGAKARYIKAAWLKNGTGCIQQP